MRDREKNRKGKKCSRRKGMVQKSREMERRKEVEGAHDSSTTRDEAH